MITKEKFKELIEDYIEQCKTIDLIENVLGSNLYGTKCVDFGFLMFDKVINVLFDDDNAEIIYSWLNQKTDKENTDHVYVDDELVPCKTVDDLWEIIKNRKNETDNK